MFDSIKRILALVGLNTYRSTQETARSRIHRVVARISVITTLIFWVAVELFSISKMNKEDFAAILIALNIAFACACVLTVYLCLMGKTQQKSDLMEYMENIVNTGKFFTYFVISGEWLNGLKSMRHHRTSFFQIVERMAKF